MVDAIKFIEKRFYSPISILIVAGLAVVMLNLIGQLYWWLFLIIVFIYSFVWLFFTFKFPTPTKGKVSIVVAIKSENERQRRLVKDMYSNIKMSIIDDGFGELIQVILLSNHKTEVFVDCVNNRYENPNKFESILKKTKSHYYIYGDLILRNDDEPTYIFRLDSLVRHSFLPNEVRNRIHNAFLESWKRQAKFREMSELKGIKTTSENAYVTARYIIGIAALCSLDPNMAFKLHRQLYEELNEKQGRNKVESVILKRLIPLLTEELFFLARIHFDRQELSVCEDYLSKSFKFSPNNYGAILLKSLIEFNKGKAKDALRLCNEASKYAMKDRTWRYNKAFLLLYFEKFEEAVKEYKVINSKQVPIESSTIVMQVVQFNLNLVKQNPTFIQSLFVLGYMYYYKLDNLLYAQEYFEKYLFSPKSATSKYQPLTVRVKTLKGHIDKIINTS